MEPDKLGFYQNRIIRKAQNIRRCFKEKNLMFTIYIVKINTCPIKNIKILQTSVKTQDAHKLGPNLVRQSQFFVDCSPAD